MQFAGLSNDICTLVCMCEKGKGETALVRAIGLYFKFGNHDAEHANTSYLGISRVGRVGGRYWNPELE